MTHPTKTRRLAQALALGCLASTLAAQDSRPHPVPTAPPTGLAARLRGNWIDEASGYRYRFEGGSAVVAAGAQQTVMRIRYLGKDALERSQPVQVGPPTQLQVSFGLDGSAQLTEVFPDGRQGQTQRLVRIGVPGDAAPDDLRIDPLPLGKPSVDEARDPEATRARATELRERLEAFQRASDAVRDLEIRPGSPRAPAGMDGERLSPWLQAKKDLEMIREQNTRFLQRELIGQGWANPEELGIEAYNARIFLIQQSNNLRLLRAAAPQLKQDFEAGIEGAGPHYASMSDRIALSLGQPQRFGTQFLPNAQGVLTPHRLEQVEGLDLRRQTYGLPTMRQYAEQLRSMGARVELPPGLAGS